MIHGEFEPEFEAVATTLERQVERSGGGAAACVYYRGRKVVDVWAGRADDAGRAWEADTLAMSFSTSKGVMATLIHVLVEQGRLDYDDPVSDHWPEFARSGKSGITVRELLSHRAGLPQIRSLVDRGDRITDWHYMVTALERAAPVMRPGRRSAYHAFTFGWLAGELAQRVTGKPLVQVLREELAEPLGLEGLFIGAPASARERAAELSRPVLPASADELRSEITRGLSKAYRWLRLPLDPHLMQKALMPPGLGDVMWDPSFLEVPVPAVNGLFSARSLARMYAMVACGGSLEGVRLLSPETIERASEVQVRSPDRVLVLPMHWRLGYHSAFTSRGRMSTGFGHFGYGGSGAWADPRRELSVAMVNNRVGGGPFGDARIAFLGTAALRCARRARSRARSARRPVQPVATA